LLRPLLLLIVLLLIARAVWRLLSGVVDGAGGGVRGGRRSESPPAMKMARDPVCGTFVVPGKALELVRGGETAYFCSTSCRDEWVRRAQ
jgi:YHS domain-containing protein